MKRMMRRKQQSSMERRRSNGVLRLVTVLIGFFVILFLLFILSGFHLNQLERLSGCFNSNTKLWLPMSTPSLPPIDSERALSYKFPETVFSYTERDAALYALGMGSCGREAVDEKELQYVYHRDGHKFIKGTDGRLDLKKTLRSRGRPGSEEDSFASSGTSKDTLLGGLLPAGFNEKSCLSRYQSAYYRRISRHLPSSPLVERLRKYESLHKRCGPNTELYNKTIQLINSGHAGETNECKYVLWISYSGLGNRILTLTATFLYALLTDRVLLIDRGTDMSDLFCEPFLETSWLLPLDFPLNPINAFNEKSPQSYGNMVKNKFMNHKQLHSHVYLHLAHNYGDSDKLFFCEDDQLLLENIPWLILRSDNYFVPSLFLIQKYEEELHNLFPQRDTVFHHLGRYLFQPTNPVWGLITRYYQAYLAKADKILGIQIRVFDTGHGPFKHVLDQILSCSSREKLLPKISKNEASIPVTEAVRSKAVLMTSLSSGYFEEIRNMYWEYPTANGEIISVFQPSYEGYQQTEKQMHNMKAWAEMYLLSLTDALITSSWSTFGYVGQALGGLRPWILVKPENKTAPDPPCHRALSMEPCFHAPPFYDCKAKRGTDTGALVPHVVHCEDMSWGLKLIDKDEW